MKTIVTIMFAISLLLIASTFSPTQDRHEVVGAVVSAPATVARTATHAAHHARQHRHDARALRLAILDSLARDRYVASWHYLNPAQQQRDLHAGDAFRAACWTKIKEQYR